MGVCNGEICEPAYGSRALLPILKQSVKLYYENRNCLDAFIVISFADCVLEVLSVYTTIS